MNDLVAGGPLRIAVIDSGIERALAPLDRARGEVLCAIGRRWREPLRRRDLRVAIAGSLGVVTSFALTVIAPLWLLALGPLLLGVPHLLSDLRYLVVRPGVHRRRGFLPLVALPLAATLVMPRLPLGLLAVAGAIAIARAPALLRAAGAALALALAAGVGAGGFAVDVAFAHAHNLVALAIWWWWRAGRPRLQLVPPLLVALGVGALLGCGDALTQAVGSLAPPRPGLDMVSIAATLAPLGNPSWSLRLLLVFAFAQSVHYGVWLRLLPDDARPRPGLRSFASSYRALCADCGRPLLLAAAALAVALIAWGLLDLDAARTAYLRVALFHGPLEIAVLAVLFIEKRRLAETE